MSPIVDFLNVSPPVEAPSAAAPTSAAGKSSGSFQEHLDAAGRRSQPAAAERNDASASHRDERHSKPGDATKPHADRPAKQSDKPSDAQAKDAAAQAKPEDDDKSKPAEPNVPPTAPAAAVAAAPLVVKFAVAAAAEISEPTGSTTADAENVGEIAKAAGTEPAVVAVSKPIAIDAPSTIAPVAVVGDETASTPIAEAPEVKPADGATTAVADVVARSKVDAATRGSLASTEAAPAFDARSTDPASKPSPAAAVEPSTEDEDHAHNAGDKQRDRGDATNDSANFIAPTDAAIDQTAASQVATAAGAAATVVIDAATTGRGDEHRGETGPPGGSHLKADRAAPQEPPRPPTRDDGSPASRAKSAGETTSLPQADRIRLVQRVAKAVQTATDRGGELKLRLSPPELGSIRLHVELRDGTLTARVETETREARQVLFDSLPQLRQRLAEQDIRVERFDVDLFNSGPGGGGANTSDRRFDGPGAGANRQSSDARPGAAARPTATVDGPKSAPTIADGRLNVVI